MHSHHDEGAHGAALACPPRPGLSACDVDAGAAGGFGLVPADDLAGDGGGVAAAEEEVAEHVGQGTAFGPGEVAVRLDAGDVVQGEKDRGDGVRRYSEGCTPRSWRDASLGALD